MTNFHWRTNKTGDLQNAKQNFHHGREKKRKEDDFQNAKTNFHDEKEMGDVQNAKQTSMKKKKMGILRMGDLGMQNKLPFEKWNGWSSECKTNFHGKKKHEFQSGWSSECDLVQWSLEFSQDICCLMPGFQI